MKHRFIFALLFISLFGFSFAGTGTNSGANTGADATSTTATSSILNSQISFNPFGNYIRVWKGTRDTKNPNGFHAQKFYRDGSLNGKELVMTPTFKGDIKNLAVGMNIPGEYFVIWEAETKNKSGLYGAFFENNSVLKGKDFLIQSSNSTAQIISSDAAMDNSGNAIVTWVTDALGQKDIFVQQIKNYGQSIGNVIQINPETLTGNCISKVVINNANGNILVAWNVFNAEENLNKIFAQRFDRDGNKIENQKLIEQIAANKLVHFDLTLNNKSEFMAIWECETTEGDLKTPCLSGKIFDWSGNIIQDKFMVNAEFDNRVAPSIRCDVKGSFVVISVITSTASKQETVFSVDASKK